MLNLYTLARLVRSSEDDAKNENLLTGILAWSVERSGRLIESLLATSSAIDESVDNEATTLFAQTLTDADNMTVGIDTSWGIAEGIGRFDLVMETESSRLIFENKIVKIGTSNCLNHEQIEKYCSALMQFGNDKDWMILCITPDYKHNATEELRKLPGVYLTKVRWISWIEIWNCAKDLIRNMTYSDFERYILREVTAGIDMAQLKPFGGFSPPAVETMKNIGHLDEILEFLSVVDARLTAPGDLALETRERLRRQAREHAYYGYMFRNYFHQKPRFGALNDYIAYGPWFKFEEGEFVAYLELSEQAYTEHSRILQCHPETQEEITAASREFAKGMDASFSQDDDEENECAGYYMTIPLDDPKMSTSLIVDFVEECLTFFVNEVVTRVFSEER